MSGSHARLWLPVVVWAGLIFALSSVPDLGTGLAFGVGVAYAVSDEVHQTFVPGRAGAPLDVAIDAIGIAVGIVLWNSVRTRRFA